MDEILPTTGKAAERLAKLAGGVAVVKVGAATETEMKDRLPFGRRHQCD